jgi:hypothetical protein
MDAMPTSPLQSRPFDVVRCDDPRVRLKCPAVAELGGARTIAEAATARDPAIRDAIHDATTQLRAWATRTATATLDQLADDLLKAWHAQRTIKLRTINARRRSRFTSDSVRPSLRPQVREAVALRLGLRGQPPTSFEAAARGRGISRERVRQLTGQVEAVAGVWLWAPALDEALRLGPEAASPEEYTDLLRARALTRRPWHPEAVNALARLCGRQQRVDCHPDLDPSLLREVADKLTRNRATGVASVSDIAALAARRYRQPVKPELVTAALADSRLAVSGPWVWRPGTASAHPRVITLARGMLAIAGHLPVAAIHAGWQRRLRWLTAAQAPPVDALVAILGAHDAFIVEGHADDPATAMVRLATPVRPEQVYPPHDMDLIEAIQASPGQLASTADLERATVNAGIPHVTLNVYLALHEAFVECGPGQWALVGVGPGMIASSASGTSL